MTAGEGALRGLGSALLPNRLSGRPHMPNEVPPTPSCRLCHQLEYSNMKTGKTSLLGRLSGVFSIALVALAFSIGGSYVVRAEQPETLPSMLREMVFVPVMRAVQ